MFVSYIEGGEGEGGVEGGVVTWTPVVSLVTSIDISNFVSMLILFSGSRERREVMGVRWPRESSASPAGY